MSYFLAPIVNTQQFDANGNPLVAGQIFTYLAGTTTPTPTYTDNTGGTSQANPIILNTLGLSASPVWLENGRAYKFVIKDAASVTLRTVDNVRGINDASATQSEWVESGLQPTFVTATSFSLVGDQTVNFQPGRRIRTQNTTGTIYSTINASAYSAPNTTVTVGNDSGVLDSGLSSVAYGLLSATNPSAPPAASPNLVRNSNFNINQRGYVSTTATTVANQYTVDGWKVITLGQSLLIAGGVDKTVTAPAGGLEQVVEALEIEGGRYTLSWVGTATATVNAVACANGAQVTLTADTNATLRFISGTVSKVKLEKGASKTAWVRPEYVEELNWCQRFYETGFTRMDTYQAAAGILGFTESFKVTKRSTPNVTATFGFSNASGGILDNGSIQSFRAAATATALGPCAFTATWAADAEF